MSNQAHPLTNASTGKVKYRVTNWPEYDRALVQRGHLTLWFEEIFLREHWRPAPTGKRGAPFSYSDSAIQALLTLKAVFDLPYRMVEGSEVQWYRNVR
ncbi:MAG: transposase [Candidatus Competibacteraceae bacterium]